MISLKTKIKISRGEMPTALEFAQMNQAQLDKCEKTYRKRCEQNTIERSYKKGKKKKVKFDSAYAILAASGNPFEDFLKKLEDKFFKTNKRKGFQYIGWGSSRNVMISPENKVYKFPHSIHGVIGNLIEAGLGSEGYQYISPCDIIDYKGVPVLEMDRVEDKSLEYEEIEQNRDTGDFSNDGIPDWLEDQDGFQVGDHDQLGLVYFDLGYSYSLANDYDLIPGIKKALDKFVPLVFPNQTFEKLYKDGADWSEHDFPVKLLKMAKRIKA